VGVGVKRLGWMVLQLAVFGGLFFAFLSDNPDVKAAGQENVAAMAVALIITLIIFGVANQIQNWLIRRRGRRVAGRVDLAQEPDHDRDGLRRPRAVIEEPPEIAQIPLREKPRKLLRPPS
jgi:hypothetical protein